MQKTVSADCPHCKKEVAATVLSYKTLCCTLCLENFPFEKGDSYKSALQERKKRKKEEKKKSPDFDATGVSISLLIFSRRKHTYPKHYCDRPIPLSQHHLTPSSRGGNNRPSNLFTLRRDKHDYWHHIFRNLTLEETIFAINLMQNTNRWNDYHDSLQYVFYRTDREWVLAVLLRIQRIKRFQKEKRTH